LFDDGTNVSVGKAISASAKLDINGNVIVTGSLRVTQNITASNIVVTNLYVQTITGSVEYITGSTQFGSLLSNTHIFTGSVKITSSLAVDGNFAVNGSTGNFAFSSNADTLEITGSILLSGSMFVTGSISVNGSITSSLLGTASYAITASHATSTNQVGYLYALHTSSQVISATNTWQELLFERNQNISDWTHTVNTGRFTSSLSAIYHIKVSANLQKTAGTSGSAAVRMLYGNDEMTGSYSSYAFSSNFAPQEIVSEAFIYMPSGSGFRTQVAATTTDFNVAPSIALGSAATYPSAKIFITRV
jgi:hypothetical protein